MLYQAILVIRNTVIKIFKDNHWFNHGKFARIILVSLHTSLWNSDVRQICQRYTKLIQSSLKRNFKVEGKFRYVEWYQQNLKSCTRRHPKKLDAIRVKLIHKTTLPSMFVWEFTSVETWRKERVQISWGAKPKIFVSFPCTDINKLPLDTRRNWEFAHTVISQIYI